MHIDQFEKSPELVCRARGRKSIRIDNACSDHDGSDTHKMEHTDHDKYGPRAVDVQINVMLKITKNR